MQRWALWCLMCPAWLPCFAADTDEVSRELDAYWAVVAETVSDGDFDGYTAGYHPDAVLVSLSSKKSYAIAQAFSRWQQGFTDTREGRMTADVEFRFSQRLHDENTAHETGIFRYSSRTGEGEPTVAYMHFEALLVKKDRWLTVMEYQKSEATEDEWNELPAVNLWRNRQAFDSTAALFQSSSKP